MKGLIAVLAVVVLAGCAPQMTMVESTSDLLPGVVYSGVYIKHPTGMNVSRVDLFEGGKCTHPGETVRDTGIVNNMTKGAVGSAFLAGGYVGGQAVRRPDQTNVSTNVSGTSGSNAGAGADAAAASAASAGVTNFNSNAQMQGQGQLQGQAQGQFQGQSQTAEGGGWIPPGQR